MNDDMHSATAPPGWDGGAARDCRGDSLQQLPTLQRNALRKLFDRPFFTPEEVAALGYRRLQQAEGIGHKGLSAIAAWLAAFGFELKAPELPPETGKPGRKRSRSVEQAVRLLRTHGYQVPGFDE